MKATEGFRIPWRAMLAASYPLGIIPLADVAEEYLGMTTRRASELATAAKLELPAFRLGSQKSEWVVRVDDFADLVESRSDEARKRWEAVAAAAVAA